VRKYYVSMAVVEDTARQGCEAVADGVGKETILGIMNVFLAAKQI